MYSNTHRSRGYWVIALSLGSLLNAALFLILPRLGRSELPPPVPVITVDFVPWQEPSTQRPKPKLHPPKPKPKPPQPKLPAQKPEPVEAPQPPQQAMLTTDPEPPPRQQPPPPPREPLAVEDPLPVPVPIHRLTSIPRFVHKDPGQYPTTMQKLGRETRVLLEVLIDSKGKVRKVTVVGSAGELFDQAAVDSIKRSTFIPGYIDGKTVTVLMKLPVDFYLK